MKTAVLLLGQTRTAKQCFFSQYDKVLRYLPHAEIFAFVEDDAQAADLPPLLAQRFAPEQIHFEKRKTPDELPQPDESHADYVPYARSGNLATATRTLVRTYWHFNAAWQWFWPQSDGFELIVKMRPDTYIHDFTLPHMPEPNEAFGCWWARCGGFNDRMAFYGRKAACAAQTTQRPASLPAAASIFPNGSGAFNS